MAKKKVTQPQVSTATTASSRSAKAFAAFLSEHDGLNASPPTPLVNITFFLGAGFSKAWHDKYPTGCELFMVPGANRDALEDVEATTNFSVPPFPANLCLKHIRQMVYTLDMNAKYLTIRSRYADDHSIQSAMGKLRTFFGRRLQQLVEPQWRWFNSDLQKFPMDFTPEQEHIRLLFSRMFYLVDGSQGHMQGARFNFITTNYDWLVELIIDNVCSDEDSAFLYLYRGITPHTICGQQPPKPAFSHDLVFNLLKLNGGLEIFRDGGGYHLDYRLRTEEKYRESPPVLMLPSREQNYQDDYFQAIFPKAVRLLQESRVLVLVGYSLPEDDALLRFIIRHFCEDEADAHKKTLFYVDRSPEDELLSRLRLVFPFADHTLRTYTYSGGFADWAAEVVSLSS